MKTTHGETVLDNTPIDDDHLPDFWKLTVRERSVWRAAYRCAENDYNVRDIPTLLNLAVLVEDQTAEESEVIDRAYLLIAEYNKEDGTL